MHKSATVFLLLFGVTAMPGALAQNVGNGSAEPPAAERAEVRPEPQFAVLEAEMRELQERMAVLAREYAALSGMVAVPGVTSARNLSELLESIPAPVRTDDIESTERVLRDLEAELEAALQRYTPRHPEVALLESRVQQTRARLLALRASEAASRERDEALRSSVERARRGAATAEQQAQRRAWVDEALRAQRQQRALEQLGGSLAGEMLRYPPSTVWDAMQLVTLTPQLGEYFGTESGILVLRAPADESLGLRDGDVILDVGGRVPTSPEHTLRILSSFVPAETLTLVIMRSGRRETLEIALPQADTPEAPRQAAAD